MADQQSDESAYPLASCATQPRPRRVRPPPDWHDQLRTVGTTGTNGKTSTTALIAQALREAHAPVPRVTTVGSYIDDERLEVAENRDGFIQTMREGLDRGARFAAIELTSEALALGFIKTWPCHVGVFTNLSRDHLDAHRIVEHYLASKAQLFLQLPPDGAAVLNGCDGASELLAEVVPPKVTTLHYGSRTRGDPSAELDLEATNIALSWTGTRVELRSSPALSKLGGHELTELEVQAVGEVYAENAMAAYCAAVAAGVPGRAAARGIASAPTPVGRFEVVGAEPHVIVDFAHTPDSLRRTLLTARRLCSGELCVLFGAGGQRDTEKRPQMGDAASVADRIVLTSDNPRSEDPKKIAKAIREGIDPTRDVVTELDRAEAIHRAIRRASSEDVILIAGKGHETTQQCGDEKRPFSDHEIARKALAER